MRLRTISHLYATYAEAADAVTALEAMGVAHADISLVGAGIGRSNAPYEPHSPDPLAATAMPIGAVPIAPLEIPGGTAIPAAADEGRVTPDEALHSSAAGAGAGATFGTVLGGGAGLLAGIGALAIPGAGPVVAAGWLIATLTGAGAGAAAGGLLGALTGAGVDEGAAHTYAEGVRLGGTLLSVRADETQITQIESILGGPARPAETTGGLRSELPAPAEPQATRKTFGSPLV